MTATMPELATLTDDQLAAMYAAGDESDWPALLAEAERRDQAERQSRQAKERHLARSAEWESASHSQFLRAEEATRGCLLSEAGKRTGREPWPMLWQGSEENARKLASEELTCWWDYTEPRIPGPAAFTAHAATARRDDEWPPEPEPEPPGPPPPPPAVAPREAMAASRERRAALMAHAYELAESARGAAPDRPPLPAGLTKPGTVAVPAPAAPVLRPTAVIAPARAKAPPEDGVRLWLLVRRYLARHVAFRTEAELDMVTAWIFHAVARERDGKGIGPLIWRASPRLLVTSRTRGAGKSTLLDLILILTQSRRGKIPKLSPAKLAEVTGKYFETVTLDEARLIFGTGTRNQELQACMLAGYTRRSSYEVAGKSLSLFGALAYAAKENLITDDVTDTIADLLDRSLRVVLTVADRPLPEVDEDAEDYGEKLAQSLIDWTDAHRAELKQAARELAAEDQAAEWTPNLRTIQITRPLRACARVAGPAIEAMLAAALDEVTEGATGNEAEGRLAELERRADAWGDGFGEDEPGRIVTADEDDDE